MARRVDGVFMITRESTRLAREPRRSRDMVSTQVLGPDERLRVARGTDRKVHQPEDAPAEAFCPWYLGRVKLQVVLQFEVCCGLSEVFLSYWVEGISRRSCPSFDSLVDFHTGSSRLCWICLLYTSPSPRD